MIIRPHLRNYIEGIGAILNYIKGFGVNVLFVRSPAFVLQATSNYQSGHGWVSWDLMVKPGEKVSPQCPRSNFLDQFKSFLFTPAVLVYRNKFLFPPQTWSNATPEILKLTN